MSVVHSAIVMKPDSLDEDGQNQMAVHHEYRIQTNNITDGLFTVRSGMGSATPHPVPSMWSTYSHPVTSETNAYLYLQSRKITRIANKEGDYGHWKVDCDWKPLPSGRNGSLPDNPMLWPVQYSLEWASNSRFIEYDYNANPMVNTAGDFFDPHEIDDARPVLVIVKNMASLPAIIALAIQYKNALNDAEFYGASAGAAKVESIVSGTIQNNNGYNFYAMTIRIQFASPNEFGDYWGVRFQNKGAHYLDDDGNKVRVRTLGGTKAGQLLTEANLDEDGFQLEASEPAIAVPLEGEDAWQVYPSRNFAGLGVGTSVA
jgi:hypothetical protein